jgi:hypothetical protein
MLRVAAGRGDATQLLVRWGTAKYPSSVGDDASHPPDSTTVSLCPLHSSGLCLRPARPVTPEHLLLDCTCTGWARFRFRQAMHDAFTALRSASPRRDLVTRLHNHMSAVCADNAARRHPYDPESDSDTMSTAMSDEETYTSTDSDATMGRAPVVPKPRTIRPLTPQGWAEFETWCREAPSRWRVGDRAPDALLHVVLLSDTVAAGMMCGGMDLQKGAGRRLLGPWRRFQKAVVQGGSRFTRECLKTCRKRFAALERPQHSTATNRTARQAS